MYLFHRYQSIEKQAEQFIKLGYKGKLPFLFLFLVIFFFSKNSTHITFKEKPLLLNHLCCSFFVHPWNFNLSQCFKLNHHILPSKKRKIKNLILVDNVVPSSTLLLKKKKGHDRHSNWFFMLCFLFIPAKECNLIRRPKTTTYLAASSCGNNSDLS